MAEEMSEAALSRLRPMPLAKRVRAVTGLSQLAFCERYEIPLSCQRDWEQARSSPPDASVLYLTAILDHPGAVAAAFNKAGRVPSV
jgi:putative transcriptional regulator